MDAPATSLAGFAMKPPVMFDFEAIVGDAADAVRTILSDRLLRLSLQGDDPRATEHEIATRWCRPSPWRHAARHCASGQIVGAISREDDTLSYFIARPHWRQGYGTALVEEYLRRSPVSMPPLQARVARGNLASRGVLRRAGFVECGLEWRDRYLAPAVVYTQTQ